jgi:hypothetical protein
LEQRGPSVVIVDGSGADEGLVAGERAIPDDGLQAVEIGIGVEAGTGIGPVAVESGVLEIQIAQVIDASSQGS